MAKATNNSAQRARAASIALQDLRDDPQGWTTAEVDGGGPSYDEMLDQLKAEGFDVD